MNDNAEKKQISLRVVRKVEGADGVLSWCRLSDEKGQTRFALVRADGGADLDAMAGTLWNKPLCDAAATARLESIDALNGMDFSGVKDEQARAALEALREAFRNNIGS